VFYLKATLGGHIKGGLKVTSRERITGDFKVTPYKCEALLLVVKCFGMLDLSNLIFANHILGGLKAMSRVRITGDLKITSLQIRGSISWW